MARTPKNGNDMQANGVTEMDPVAAAAQAKLKKSVQTAGSCS